MAMLFKPHSLKQEKAILSRARINISATGIQWGKTTDGAWWLKLLIHELSDPKNTFIIGAPSYKILHQSTLPPFLSIMEGLGEYHRGDEVLSVDGGGKIFFRSLDNPDSIVGLTNVRGIWIDEAGLLSLYAWENVQGRASFKDCPIKITTSPYAMNWLWKDLVNPKMKNPDAHPDISLTQAESRENPLFPQHVWDIRQKTMEPKRFAMMFGGRFERPSGLVYDCFSIDNNICEPMTLETGTKLYGGIDWGHTHPFVCKIRAITPTGGHYQVSEFYKQGLTILDIIEYCRQVKSVWGVELFYCGPDRPENIIMLNQHGIPAVAAKNDVLHGIDLHYELIKTGKFKIFAGSSPHTIDEYETYHWPSQETESDNKDIKERHPVKQNDDTMDVDRYLTLMLYNRNIEPKSVKKAGLLPTSPRPETAQEFINRIHKRPKTGRTESWN